MNATEQAIEHFTRRLQHETDVSDVAERLASGDPGLVLVDVRDDASWAQGRIAGALHLPRREIAARARALVPGGAEVVTYCWGPGCNGATKGALAFAELGYRVKEMLGGYEYWVREGLETESAAGPRRLEPDALTVAIGSPACAC
ncbi:rhodanese-like domain-containing protein [Motilibacter deserti]|uniref:Rhodanese-like domain-containing protein n=1 Tax=Motilibacter deserti TaxID=2714956 RepID=A0ABX0GSL3_9ACTN|nr:rhodanese-like domain-containing protein [Motilibacter deserti]NHC13086.1 rhodanese-like domain-containing protein [Motilibacter deserti]